MSRGQYPSTRMRRTRMAAFSRRLVAETRLDSADLIWPLFVIEGTAKREPILSMPGVFRQSIDLLVEQAARAVALNIPAIAVFPSLLAQAWYIRGVQMIGPGRAGIFVNLVPVFAAILGVAFLSEPFGVFHAVVRRAQNLALA